MSQYLSILGYIQKKQLCHFMFASLLKLGELIRIFSSVRKYFLLRVDSIWRVQSSMEAIFNTSKQDQSAKVVPFVKMAEKHGIHLKITPGQVITVIFGYKTVFMPPTSEKLRGHIGLGRSVRPSVRPSVCPSVRPSVCPSVCLSVILGS